MKFTVSGADKWKGWGCSVGVRLSGRFQTTGAPHGGRGADSSINCLGSAALSFSVILVKYTSGYRYVWLFVCHIDRESFSAQDNGRPVKDMTEYAARMAAGGVGASGLPLLPGSRYVKLRGRTVYLNPMEYSLLMVFLRHPGVPLSRTQLMKEVWRTDFLGESRTVDVHVASLRKKLGWRGRIQSVRKVGYRLVPGEKGIDAGRQGNS